MIRLVYIVYVLTSVGLFVKWIDAVHLKVSMVSEKVERQWN